MLSNFQWFIIIDLIIGNYYANMRLIIQIIEINKTMYYNSTYKQGSYDVMILLNLLIHHEYVIMIP